MTGFVSFAHQFKYLKRDTPYSSTGPRQQPPSRTCVPQTYALAAMATLLETAARTDPPVPGFGTAHRGHQERVTVVGMMSGTESTLGPFGSAERDGR